MHDAGSTPDHDEADSVESFGSSTPSSAMAETLDPFLTASETLDADAGPLAVGTQVDDLRVMRLLGRGGMGEVYLARDLVLGRKVALKRLRASTSRPALESLISEARALARCNHPHIVTIYAAGTHGGAPYIALEYLEGEDLSTRLKRQRPALGQALRWGVAIADALEAAHGAGVLHRDLKPGNVMLPRDGRLRVVDFGLARPIAAEQRLTRRRGISGTPGFMAPEQWRGEACTPATDVWALGVMLYLMIAGELPFRGRDPAHLSHVTTGPMPAPRLLASPDGRPAGLVDIIGRCLAKRPSDRPTVAECLSALRAMLHPDLSPAVEGEGPYRGLEPFTERHAGLFFGRDAELSAALERLDRAPTLLVLGPSGAGKSSFVQAGLMPRLRERGRWFVLTVRPGPDPFGALARLLGAPAVPGVSADALRTHPHALGKALRARARSIKGSVLLFVDQLEEAFALAPPADAERFVEALCLAADDPADPVRAVATMRDAFVGRVATSAGRGLLQQLMVLTEPSAPAMARIVRRPLSLVGYRFEEPTMVDEMVAAVDGDSAALPLLEFAAHQLWQARDTERRLLTRAALRDLGGVEGVLARHADRIVAGFTDLRPVRALCLRLVTPEGTRRIVTREALLDGLEPEASLALDRLIDARLVSARRSDGVNEVELTHESLITQWHRLARWLETSSEARAVSAEIEAAAQLWMQRGRRASELWDGDALFEARRALDRVAEPPRSVRAFVEAGEAHVHRQRLRSRAIWGLLIAGLIAVVLSLAITSNRADQARAAAQERALDAERQRVEARTQARKARSHQAAALRASARAAHATGRPLEARARLRAAMELEDHPSGRALWQAVQEAPLLWRHRVDSTIQQAALDPTGYRIAIAADDGILRVFDLRDGREVRLRSASDNLLAVHWSSPEDLLVGTARSGLLRARPDARHIETLVESDGPWVGGITQLADGSIIYESNKSIYRCTLPCREQTQIGESRRRLYSSVAAPKALRLLTSAGVADLQLHDIDAGTDHRFEGGHPDNERPAIFVDDDTIIVGGLPTLRDISVARLVGGRPGPLEPLWAQTKQGLTPPLRALSASADGRLALGDNRGGVWLGTLDSPPTKLGSIVGQPIFTGLDADGAIVSVGHDGDIRRWRVPRPKAPVRVEPTGEAGLMKLHVDPVGGILTMVGQTLTRWSHDGVALTQTVNDEPFSLWGARFAPNSPTMLGWFAEVLFMSVPGVRRMYRTPITRSAEGAPTPLYSAGDQLYRKHPSGPITARTLTTPDGQPLDGSTFLLHDAEADLLVVAGHGSVGRWGVEGGRPRWLLNTGSGPAENAALSVDGTQLLVSSWGAGLLALNPETGAVLHRPTIDYAPEGLASLATGFYVLDDVGHIHHYPRLDAPARRVRLHRGTTRRVAAGADGQSIVTFDEDRVLRSWDAELRPRWRGITLWAGEAADGGPWRATHRGWSGPDGRPPWSDTTWAAQIARSVSAAMSESHACAVGLDGTIHWMPRRADTASVQWTAPGRFAGVEWPEVTVSADRCLIRHAERAWLWLPDAPSPQPIVLPADASPSRVSAPGRTIPLPDGFAALAGGALLLLDHDGVIQRRYDAPDAASALARLPDGQWIIGTDDGRFERLTIRPDTDTLRLVETYTGTAPSAVTAIASGPRRTLIVGHANGQVEMWSLEDGQRLRTAWLNGAVTAIGRVDARLVVLSEAGDLAEWSVDALTADHCALTRAMWADTPATWRDRVVLAPPPLDHPCAADL